MTPVGAVSNRTASACPDSRDPDLSGLETLLVPTCRDSALRNPIYRGAPTKHRERKCLSVFKIHYSNPSCYFAVVDNLKRDT